MEAPAASTSAREWGWTLLCGLMDGDQTDHTLIPTSGWDLALADTVRSLGPLDIVFL